MQADLEVCQLRRGSPAPAARQCACTDEECALSISTLGVEGTKPAFHNCGAVQWNGQALQDHLSSMLLLVPPKMGREWRCSNASHLCAEAWAKLWVILDRKGRGLRPARTQGLPHCLGVKAAGSCSLLTLGSLSGWPPCSGQQNRKDALQTVRTVSFTHASRCRTLLAAAQSRPGVPVLACKHQGRVGCAHACQATLGSTALDHAHQGLASRQGCSLQCARHPLWSPGPRLGPACPPLA